jgi:hypothetical protein
MHARIKTNTKLASMIVSTQQSAAYKDHVCVVVTGVLVYRGRAVPSIRATKMEGAIQYTPSVSEYFVLPFAETFILLCT